MRRRPAFAAGLVAVALLTVCCDGGSPSPFPTDDSLASATPVALPGFPPGCKPLELRGPDGRVVDLSGTWGGSGVLIYEGERAFLSQHGDCLLGSVLGGYMLPASAGADEGSIANLKGRIGSDQAIATDIVIVFQDAFFNFGEVSSLVILLEWDAEGRVQLREDREPGARASRCQPALDCNIAPFVWYRLDE